MTTHDLTPEDDPFVQRLRARRPAAPPAHWREDILSAALCAAEPPRTPRWRAAANAFAEWLWPHPRAYMAMLAVWLLILVLRLSASSLEPSTVPRQLAETTNGTDYALALTREQLAINTAVFIPARREEVQP